MTDEPDVKVVPFRAMSVLPPPPGVCPECAVDHESDEPHSKDSLHYQYAFRNAEARAGREERWPTWVDAMAHCTPEVQTFWREALEEKGVDVHA